VADEYEKRKHLMEAGWRVEELPRMGQILLLFYKDGEVRGQIEIQNKGELERWKKATEHLNTKEASPKNSSNP
jgi:hypothetical protein